MRIWLQRITALVLFWSYVWLVVLSSGPLFHPLTQEQSQGNPQYQQANGGGDLKESLGETFWVRLTTDPVAFFTAVLAAFTIVLGGSTILLWWETRKGGEINRRMAAAAELSARAAIGIELPIIRAFSPDLNAVDAPVPPIGPVASTPLTLSPSAFCYVPEIKFQNFGRTNAFVDSLRIGWEVCRNMYREPLYRFTIVPRGLPICLPGEPAEGMETPSHTIVLTKDQVDAIDAREVFLWFFVEYRYADFLGSDHVARFCWQWACPEGVGDHYLAAVGNPPEGYTRHK